MQYRLTGNILAAWLFFITLAGCGNPSEKDSIKFPPEQPRGANFNRPFNGEVLEISPPGFCWWRAGDKNKVSYRLRIQSTDGREVHSSPLLKDPVYVPSIVLEPGKYTWTVEASDAAGKKADTRKEESFEIAAGAIPLPWVDPADLLARVPTGHPRLLFPESTLSRVREDIRTNLKEPWETIKKAADQGLGIPLMEKPLWDTLTGEAHYPAMRVAYRESFHLSRQVYSRGVVPMALVYLVSRDKKYGMAAKKHLLHITDWSHDGSMQVQDGGLDELGLTFARVLPKAYDWTYDLFTPEERIKMENWMVALADSFLYRMERTDFVNRPSGSHSGRLPGYFMEFAIVLAGRPEAIAWMDYGMKTALTVWPHWAGSGGGWAEGVNYSMGYNERYITSLQALLTSTGYNLWQKPFFRRYPDFLTYCISPVGEISPFGDAEESPVHGKTERLSSMFLYYSQVFQDPGMRWWSEFLNQGNQASDDPLSNIRRLYVPDTIKAVRPNLPPDRAFPGIGWAAFHSDINHPEEDLMVLFKSSPYGSASHSHSDQNSFAIMKGGKALAIPGGARYPQHGSPFHREYNRLTMAHNALLINGKGQLDRDHRAFGEIKDFRSLPHIGYVAGDARAAYGLPVTKYLRHVLLIRPSLVIVLDELEMEEAAQVDWLLHGKEKFVLDEENQRLTSVRGNLRMEVTLMAKGGFGFSQTNEWPVDPKKDYPMVTAPPPAKQWHFTGHLQKPVKETIIAASMSIGNGKTKPRLETTRQDSGDQIIISSLFEGGNKAVVTLNLGRDPDRETSPMIEIKYQPASGDMETLVIHFSE